MSEHDWEWGVVVACDYIGGLPPRDFRRTRNCRRCGQGDAVPLRGYRGGFCVGFYCTWDGVSTCEDVIERNEKSAAEAAVLHAAKLRRVEEERPRRRAFLDALNALCSEHGAHIGTNEHGESCVVLELETYELAADGVSVTAATRVVA